jgi:hypothetical protein
VLKLLRRVLCGYFAPFAVKASDFPLYHSGLFVVIAFDLTSPARKLNQNAKPAVESLS